MPYLALNKQIKDHQLYTLAMKELYVEQKNLPEEIRDYKARDEHLKALLFLRVM